MSAVFHTKIESNIPMPLRPRETLARMNPGDSFEFTKTNHSAVVAAMRHMQKLTDMRFMTRTCGDGKYRIWRRV